MPSRFSRSLLKCANFLVFGAIGMQPHIGYAQPKPTPASSAQLSRQFRDGFMRGCTPGKTPGVRNQVNYCNCLADGYLKRYDGTTLTAISQLAGSLGEKGPLLVNVMISPEAKVCAARN
jgi:hypothetical protein